MVQQLASQKLTQGWEMMVQDPIIPKRFVSLFGALAISELHHKVCSYLIN
jgi:hypothetical protein